MAFHWCRACRGTGGPVEGAECPEGPCHAEGSCRGRPTMARLSGNQADKERA